MCSGAQMWSYSLLLLAMLQGVLGLNIDPLTPTVVNSGVLNGSEVGFGFTLTQHQFSDGRKTVLVSAPKVDGQFVREGGVYSCPYIHGGSCQFEDVFQSKLNVRGDDPFIAQPSTLPLAYTDQLLGYSLRSFDNYVVACAPLYINRPTIIQVSGVQYQVADPNGRCIILDSDLNSATPLQLFSGDVPSLRVAGVDTGIVGQAGSERLVFGSVLSGSQPVPTGQVFLTSLNSTLLGTDELSSEGGVSSFLPLTGYHIESGFFTTPGTRQIVTSAPRNEDHFGSVEILTIGVTLVTVTSIIGKEADGYFGYDFAVVNFDPESGELDSLVIGCPLCNRERGRVYVYTHTGNTANPFTEESVIEAPSSSRGRFGLVVENIRDIDLDGIDDIAVSAPFEGEGVVYVYRGTPSGLITKNPQIIRAEPGATVFGYQVTGGTDIDSNGYPDITVSDLSGDLVTSYRSSPLVNVTFDLENRREALDILGDSDRVCQLSENVNLACFDITPCFQFDSKFGNVTRFALSYTVTVDGTKSRAAHYQVDSVSGDATLGGSSYTDIVTVEAPGEAGRVCAPPLTFALSADFTDTSPISVQFSIDDSPQPLALDSTPSSNELGGALHPILRRYLRGDVPMPLSLEYDINFNVNCSSGASLECEPVYQLSIQEDFMSDDNTLVLASANVFGYRVNVSNTAGDDGLSPTLVVQLPRGMVLENSVSLSPSAVTECNSRLINDQLSNFTTAVECALRNPTLAGKTLQLELFFGFNLSGIPLDTESLEFTFLVIDGISGNISTTASKEVRLEAVGDYGISSVVSEERYIAFRNTIYRNASTIPLNETGPLLNFRVSVRNSREATNGTAFPRTTLLIHLPVEHRDFPLLIPTEIVATSGTINCSHYQAIPRRLSVIQEPAGFIPPWTGPPPPIDPACNSMGQFTCGVILCTIADLGPTPGPPAELTLFARLFSPGVQFVGDLTIYSQLIKETLLPRQGEDSVTQSTVSFLVSPAVTEVAQECVPYWVVVVAVVVGIIVLVAIISILALCGLFRRWYKNKKSGDMSNGVEQTDSEFFQRRTIPPIPGITQSGAGQPELTSYVATGEAVDEEKEKEAEAEEEAELERELNESAAAEEDVFMDFDPAQGVHDDDGEETEL